MLEGWRWRDRHEWERAAWAVAYLLQPHLQRGRTLKPADLLRSPSDTRAESEAEQILDPQGAWKSDVEMMYAKQKALREKGTDGHH